MEFKTFSDTHKFADTVSPFFATREIENSMVLGILGQCHSRADPNIHMYAVLGDSGTPLMAAIMTTHQIQLSTSEDKAAIRCMADNIIGLGVDIPGFGGPAAIAPIFAEQIQERGYGNPYKRLEQTLYTAGAIAEPNSLSGELKQAVESDIEWLFDWLGCMATELGLPESEQRRDQRNYDKTLENIEQGQLFYWTVSGDAVAIAGYTPIGRDGARIGGVYTSPGYRGNGYAGACVAALTHRLQQSGKWCALSADITNPNTNRLYHKLGYQPHCNSIEYSL